MRYLVPALLFASILNAQEGQQCHSPAPPSPMELGQVGKAHLPITGEPGAQADFDAALAILHSFFYPEARLRFETLALNGSFAFTDKSYEKVKQAGALLEGFAARYPNHPGIAHYLIHSYDYPPLAARALGVARGYAAIAPKVPHALHMPSHIFTRLGLWDESIRTNLASQKAAEEYAALRYPGKVFSDQLHAMDYLEYAYLQTGELERARDVIAQIRAVKGVEPANDFAAAYALAAIPARYAIETRGWKAAASLELGPGYITWAMYPHMEAGFQFAKALGAAKTGDFTSARNAVERLEALKAAIPAKLKYWRDPVEVQRQAALAWLRQGEGHQADALALMRSAADLEGATEKHPVTPGAILPAREQLGDLLLEQGQAALALREFEKALQAAPNRFNSLYGAARAAQASGQPSLARRYFQQLVALAKSAERPEVLEAKAYLLGAGHALAAKGEAVARN